MIKKLSNIGRHHLDTAGENQDALCYDQDKNFCVISLADGVSTCKEARKGAEIACRTITELLLKKGASLMESDDQQIAELAVSYILAELQHRARKDERNVEEYSSTVSSVLVDKKKKRLLCFQLGDGIILAAGKGRCSVLAMPSNSLSGCCVTTTRNANTMASVRRLDADSVESVVICSDGAWRHMYHKNRLKPEVAALLADNAYDGLKDFLTAQDCFDDYSFISLDLRKRNRRKLA